MIEETNNDYIEEEIVRADYTLHDDRIEIHRERLRKLTVCLGEGHYGEVWLGCLLCESGNGQETVAIKMPKQLCVLTEDGKDELKSERKSIRNELNILLRIGKHENVLELKGAVTLMKDHFWMVLEYCELGSLDKYLADKKKNQLFVDEIVMHADDLTGTTYKSYVEADWVTQYESRRKDGFVTTSDLFLFGLQIANGMDFLHGKEIVHCDLALRNILLNLNYTIKIADFGLSRQTRNGYYSRKSKKQAIPLFWTAPEALKNSKVLLESDRWTFGVVLWELFELSGIPYESINGNRKDLLEFLDNGHRLAKPRYSPPEIYRLMLSLWNMKPQNRPSLNTCQLIIQKQLELSCRLLVPPRLLDAWRLMSDKPDMYSNNDDESSSGYSSSDGDKYRSRTNSALSEDISYLYLPGVPAVPKLRPPAHSFSSYFSNCTSNQQILQIHIQEMEQTPHLHSSKISLLQLGDSEQNEQQDQQQKLQSQPQEEGDFQPLSLQRVQQLAPDDDSRFYEGRIFRKKLLALVLVASLMLGISLTIFFVVLRQTNFNENSVATTTGSFYSYNCVNGSRALVWFKKALRPLVDLNIPEMPPTWTNGSFQYLFVSEQTQRRYAQKICTAWCGHLVPVREREQNNRILERVRNNLREYSYYWIGVRGWKGNWYMDDESNVTFLNFLDLGQANQSIINSADDSVEIDSACVQVNASGVWSTIYCEEMRPFLCERNTANKDIQRTPFEPFQEKQCASVGGRCQYDTECHNDTSQIVINLCPSQALNIRCCFSKIPIPPPVYNSSVSTCEEAEGICNHVSENECRDGQVIFDLKEPCPDRPRKLGCCVK